MLTCDICSQLVMVKPIQLEFRPMLEKLNYELCPDGSNEMQWICIACEMNIAHRYQVKLENEAAVQMLQMQMEDQQLRKMINLMQQSYNAPIEISSDEDESKEPVAMEIVPELFHRETINQTTQGGQQNLRDMQICRVDAVVHTNEETAAIHCPQRYLPNKDLLQKQHIDTNNRILLKKKYIINDDNLEYESFITEIEEIPKQKKNEKESSADFNGSDQMNASEQVDITECTFSALKCDDDDDDDDDDSDNSISALCKSITQHLTAAANKTQDNSVKQTADAEPKSQNQSAELNWKKYFVKTGNNYFCQKCEPPKKFPTYQHIRYHVISWHLGLSLFKCEECGVKYKAKSSLDYHYRKKHGKKMVVAQKLVDSSSQQHLNEKIGLVPQIKESSPKLERTEEQITHPSCTTAEDAEDPVAAQIKHKNLTNSMYKKLKNKFKCTQCNAIFKHRVSINYHIDAVHLKIQHKCTVCGVIYKSKEGLIYHLRERHDLKMSKARYKQQKFGVTTNFLELERISSPLPEIDSNVKNENERPTGSNPPANSIQRKLRVRKMLPKLEESHETYKHRIKYKKFRSMATGRTYACNECPADAPRYKSVANVNYHIKTYHLGMGYKCRECSESNYTSVNGLKYHYASKHKDIPMPEEYQKMTSLNPTFMETCQNRLQRKSFFKKVNNKYTCILCPADSTVLYNFRNSVVHHLNSVHFKTTYNCIKCFAEFKSRPGLSFHYKEKHGE